MITSDTIEYGVDVSGQINTVTVLSPVNNILLNDIGNEISISGTTNEITVLSPSHNVSVMGQIYNINISNSGGGGSGNSYFPSGW